MFYKIVDGQVVVQSGELTDTYFRGKNIEESKVFFNQTATLSHPIAIFYTSDKRVTHEIELKQTAKGYSSVFYEYGKMYGCNLNRIKNRRGRWGLTIWIEPTDTNTAAAI